MILAVFLTYGMREAHMEHFEKDSFETEYGVSGMAREKRDSYETIYVREIAVGVVFCILAVILTIIVGAMEAPDYYCGISVGLLLFILSIGVNFCLGLSKEDSAYVPSSALLEDIKKLTDTPSQVFYFIA